MRYVLMYTNRPDLDAAVPPERQQAVYQAVYAWFGANEASFADGGAELLGPETATTVRYADSGDRVVMLRAEALRFESGAITSRVTPSISRS
jgi:hypothetical protein